MNHFENVAPRVGPDTCPKCLKGLTRGDRILEVHLAAGVGSNPSGAGQMLYVSETREYAHLRCRNPSLVLSLIEIPRASLHTVAMTELVRPRTPDYQCAVCQKKLQREDRIIVLTLVQGVAIDPDLKVQAVECSNEFEVAHFDCNDARLEKANGLSV